MVSEDSGQIQIFINGQSVQNIIVSSKILLRLGTQQPILCYLWVTILLLGVGQRVDCTKGYMIPPDKSAWMLLIWGGKLQT